MLCESGVLLFLHCRHTLPQQRPTHRNPAQCNAAQGTPPVKGVAAPGLAGSLVQAINGLADDLGAG